jgi:hypothetical protein
LGQGLYISRYLPKDNDTTQNTDKE